MSARFHRTRRVLSPGGGLLSGARHCCVALSAWSFRRRGQVTAGSEHTVLLTDMGSVFTCGNGSFGRLGHGHSRSLHLPQVIQSLLVCNEKIAMVSAGGEHTLALSVTGLVYAWGSGQCGRLGLGTDDDTAVPTPIATLQRAKVNSRPPVLRPFPPSCDSRLWCLFRDTRCTSVLVATLV